MTATPHLTGVRVRVPTSRGHTERVTPGPRRRTQMKDSRVHRSLQPCLDELVMRRQETGTAPGALQRRLDDLAIASAVDEPLTSEATPPEVPSFAVFRGRLVSLVDLAVQQRLTIVVAPAGYGKTVLLAQWATCHPLG